jgi:hypothetical protein
LKSYCFYKQPIEDYSKEYQRGYDRFQYPCCAFSAFKEPHLLIGLQWLTLPHIDSTQPCGWPQIAAFLESADSFGIYRGFGQSHARLLVAYETDITRLENQIHELDVADEKSEEGVRRLISSCHPEGFDTTRRDLLAQLEQKLLSYGTCLGTVFRTSRIFVFGLIASHSRYLASPASTDQNSTSDTRTRPQECIQMDLE